MWEEENVGRKITKFCWTSGCWGPRGPSWRALHETCPAPWSAATVSRSSWTSSPPGVCGRVNRGWFSWKSAALAVGRRLWPRGGRWFCRGSRGADWASGATRSADSAGPSRRPGWGRRRCAAALRAPSAGTRWRFVWAWPRRCARRRAISCRASASAWKSRRASPGDSGRGTWGKTRPPSRRARGWTRRMRGRRRWSRTRGKWAAPCPSRSNGQPSTTPRRKIPLSRDFLFDTLDLKIFILWRVFMKIEDQK